MEPHCAPGPAKYTLPSAFGYIGHDIRKTRSPAYSFGTISPQHKKFITPGPNQYDIKSTIGAKNAIYKTAAQSSFHRRLPTKELSRSPGPSEYSLQNFKPGKRAPAYSITARAKDPINSVEC